jgi:hypothetical protein
MRGVATFPDFMFGRLLSIQRSERRRSALRAPAFGAAVPVVICAASVVARQNQNRPFSDGSHPGE